ncbi:MAG: uS2 family ribosomal protein [Candidatus Pacearchaeota archaeon]|nr:uS2 family ribosomal protein [Candidatus Pacearchaeota archaeon]
MKFNNFNKILSIFVFGILVLGFFGSAQEVAKLDDLVVIGEEVWNQNTGYLEKGEYALGESQEIGGLVIDADVDSDIVIGSNVNLKKENDATIFTYNEQGGSVEIYGDKFDNIKPKCSSKVKSVDCSDTLSFIKIDTKGEVISADYETDDKNGYVTIEGTSVFVPANSRVIYTQKDGIKIIPSDGSVVEKTPELKEGYDEVRDVVYEGKYINFLDASRIVEGSVKLNEYGYVLKEDTIFEYEGLMIPSVSGDFLIANEEVEEDFLVSSDYSYLKQTSNELLVGNKIEGDVSIEVVGYNGFLGTDSESTFSVNVPKGNYLSFEKSEDGAIEMTHSSVNPVESTKIINGKNEFDIGFEKIIVKDSGFDVEAIAMTMMSDSATLTDKYGSGVEYTLEDVYIFVDSDNKVYSSYGEENAEKIVFQNEKTNPIQSETDKQFAIEDKVRELQNLLVENKLFLNKGLGGCQGNDPCQIDGKYGGDTNVAVLSSGVRLDDIPKDIKGADYYDEIIVQLNQILSNK